MSEPVERAGVQLHSRGGRSFPYSNVYFPFASGRLSYDCHACRSTCCRGFGYLSAPDHALQRQVAGRPLLPLFLEPREETSLPYLTTNCAPGCFFLADDGLCEIHAQWGRAAKPETCRLFPFNDILTLGGFLIVRPHPSLCPLAVVDHGQTNRLSDYSDLLAGLSELGISAKIGEASTRTSDVARLIADERRIVQLSEQWIERGDFLGFLRAQAGLLSDAPGSEWTGISSELEGVLDYVLNDLCGDIVDLASSTEVDRTMIALTPFVRSHLLFSRDERVGAGISGRLNPATATYALASVYVLARAAAATGMKRITLQTITKLLNEFGSLVHTTAFLNRPMVWRSGAPVGLSNVPERELRVALIRLAKRLLPGAQRGRPTPLGRILHESMPAESTERLRFVRVAFDALGGRLAPLGAPRPERKYRATWRAGLKGQIGQWALGAFNEEIIEIAYGRLANRAAKDASSVSTTMAS